MKRMKWISNESRVIPGLGRMEKGSERDMPTEQAESYKAQGLMEEVKSKSTTRKKQED